MGDHRDEGQTWHINVIVKQTGIIKWKWRIRECLYIQIWAQIYDRLTQETARGCMPPCSRREGHAIQEKA